MEENNFSDVINKFSDILKEKNINLQDYIDEDLNKEINNNSNNNNKNNSNNNSNNGLNIDINTILKIKTIAEKLNNNNNPRSSLLQALKPFLSEKKQDKLDEYIKIANIISILEILNKDIW